MTDEENVLNTDSRGDNNSKKSEHESLKEKKKKNLCFIPVVYFSQYCIIRFAYIISKLIWDVICLNVKHKQENRLIKGPVPPTAVTPPPDCIAAIILH